MQRKVGAVRGGSSNHKQAILRAYPDCGLTQREFAHQNGIPLSTLQFWLRQQRLGSGAAKPAFVALPPLAPVPLTAYRLELPGGLVLNIPPGFNAAELQSLLPLLR